MCHCVKRLVYFDSIDDSKHKVKVNGNLLMVNSLSKVRQYQQILKLALFPEREFTYFSKWVH